MVRRASFLAVTSLCCVWYATAQAATVSFFNSSQVATNVASGITSDTISSNGYLFTYTRDKLFTGGYGMTEPIGRTVRVPWPNGVEAQAVTSGPNPSKAQITISRVDADVFDLTAFTAKLLANTAGAGGSIEIMPSLNGEDPWNDPLWFDATGNAGNTFSYDTSPYYWGSTALLTGYDTYTIDLYVDFAFTALTLQSAGPDILLGDYRQDGIVDVLDYIAWRNSLNQSVTPLSGADGNGNGVVDEGDFLVWKANFGQVGGNGAAVMTNAAVTANAAIPEPATLPMVLAAILMIWPRRRAAAS